MTQERLNVWLWIVSILILGLLLFCAISAHPQELKHRTEPPTLQPESCRDHIARTRHTFLDAAKVEVDQKAQDNLARLYNSFGNPKMVDFWCPSLAKDYDFVLSLATYECRYNAKSRSDCP